MPLQRAVCSQEGNKYTCSGADHDTQNLTGDVLDVVLDGTSYINTDSGYGLSVTGSSLTITQQEGGIIVADGSGINIENTGTGDTTLNISGTVVAKEPMVLKSLRPTRQAQSPLFRKQAQYQGNRMASKRSIWERPIRLSRYPAR
ncbi:hypothetical protein WDV93_20855 [Pantoea ananatis]